jgi:multimeric flavodoxin WrbA
MMPFYEKLLQAERIVMAFPVFFLGPPAITKAFIDRAQALWIRKYILHTKPEKEGIVRKGFLLSVGGFRGSERIFACNVSITKSFFATCGYKYSGELLFTGIDHYGDLKKRGEIREDALKAGRDFSVQ